MTLPTTYPAQGTTIEATTAGWTGQIVSFGVDGFTLTTRKVTHYGTTGYHQYKPSSVEEPGTITMQIQLDPDDLPPDAGVVDTWTITFSLLPGQVTAPTLSGTGFRTELSVDGTQGDEGEVLADLTVQFDGDTGPTWTPST